MVEAIFGDPEPPNLPEATVFPGVYELGFAAVDRDIQVQELVAQKEVSKTDPGNPVRVPHLLLGLKWVVLCLSRGDYGRQVEVQIQGVLAKHTGLLRIVFRLPVPVMNFHHHGGAFQVFPQVTGVHRPEEDDVDILEVNVGCVGLPLGRVDRSVVELVPAVHRHTQPLQLGNGHRL